MFDKITIGLNPLDSVKPFITVVYGQYWIQIRKIGHFILKLNNTPKNFLNVLVKTKKLTYSYLMKFKNKL